MQDGLEPLEVKETKRPQVRVFAGHSIQTQYHQIGDGVLQLVTDLIIPTSQHYLQVTDTSINELILRSRLQKNNGYQRKKNSIITWHDPEQEVQKDIALSFLHKEECNMYWRMICSKIGKDYLQINRHQRLEKPNEKNSLHLYQKSKNSYQLVAFNIINSPEFMEALWKVSHKFRQENDVKGLQNIGGFLREVLSHWDPTIMRVLLKTENFENFLMVFQCTYIKNSQKVSEYPLKAYHQLGKFKQIVEMSKHLIKDINIALNAKFFKQLVNFNQLLLDNDQIVRMVDQVLKDTHHSLLNLVIQECIIDKIVKLYQSANQLQSGFRQTFQSIIKFFKQLYSLIWSLQSYTIRKEIYAEMRNPKVFLMFAKMLQKECFEILDILVLMAKEDTVEFFKSYKQNFRTDSSNSLNRIISKLYLENSSQRIKLDILSFFRQLLVEVDNSRENYDFFSGTLLVSGYDRCNNIYRKICFAAISLEKLQYNHYHSLMAYFLKKDIFGQFLASYLNQKTGQIIKFPNKYIMMEFIKIIKLIVQMDNFAIKRRTVRTELEQYQRLINRVRTPKDFELERKVNRYVLESKAFYFCLKYLQKFWKTNNIITSSIFEIVYAISLGPYTIFTKYMQEEYKFDLSNKQNTSALQKYISVINKKTRPDDFQQDKAQEQVQTHHLRTHKHRLQQEIQEQYLLSDINQGQRENKELNQFNQDSLAQLIKMKQQLDQKHKENNQSIEVTPVLDTKKEQQGQFKLQINLPPLQNVNEEDNNEISTQKKQEYGERI